MKPVSRLPGQLLEAGRAGFGVALSTGLLAPPSPSTIVRMAGIGLRHGPAASALLGLSAARWPDRTCLIDDAGALSYVDVYDRAARLAGGLAHRGVTRGSRVGVMGRNRSNLVVAMFATLWTDADLVLLNTDFGSAQLAGVMAAEGLTALLHDSEFDSIVAGAELGGLEVRLDGQGPGSVDDLVEEGRRPPRGGGRHGRLVILTSGTTGAPKGSRRDPDVLGAIAPLSSLVNAIRLRSGDPVMILPPVFHGFGLAYLLMAISLGCPVSVLARADADVVLERIAEDRIQVLFAVPVMLGRMADAAAGSSADWSTLRAVQSGAAPLAPALAERFMSTFGELLHDVYGSTETGWSTLAGPSDLRAAPGTVGPPLRGVSVRILDDADVPISDGAVGQVFVDSGMTSPDYTGGGSKRIVDGHVSTGDLGHLDSAGRLFIDGREDDMIVSGGENVFPGEVEDLLAAHPDVVEVLVHGVADDEFGQRLRAVVVRRDGSSLSEDAVRAYVREHLARYKVPRDVEFVETLVRTATGKIKRQA